MLFSHRLTLCCAALSFATFASAAAAATHDAPLEATISFSEQLATAPNEACGPLPAGIIHGTGSAARLGSVTLSSIDCITPLSPQLNTFTFFSSPVVLSTPSGDIYAVDSGILSPQGVIRGAFTIVGGTGAFIGATGSGTLHGVEAISETGGTGRIHLSGKISY